MGQTGGFLKFDRENNPGQSPAERIQHWNEFHWQLSEKDRRRQGARCMECGVPYCQSGVVLNGMVSGCPLHNLIPEWNDCVYTGNFDFALQRLLKTNNFPEFTGRVCPALCEAACTCSHNGKAVTVRENELYIIENGYHTEQMQPRIPKIRTEKRVAVIGSGPAGLACADQLNHRGHNVTVFEREDRIGGLLMYGIPNMKLEKQIVNRRVELMQAEGVQFITKVDVGHDKNPAELLKDFDAIVLCCGAKKPRDLKVINRESNGVYFAVDFLTANTKSLLNSSFVDGAYIDPKGKNVVIVGGGDTGNDCVGTCIRHQCKSVIQLEMMPKAPEQRTENNPWPEWPRTCKTDYGQEEAIAVFGKDPRLYSTTVTEFIADENHNLIAIKTVQLDTDLKPIPGTETQLDCDLLIIAAGFLGCQDYLPNAFGIELTPRSVVKTEPNSYATNLPGVFTAGDMHRGQSLVVWAIAEGRAAARQVDQYLMGYTNLP